MKYVKLGGVILIAGIITSFAIDAADTVTGHKGTFLSQVIETTNSCPDGMIAVSNIPSLSCVDIYEASTGASCAIDVPDNILDSNTNINDSDCVPVSVKGKTPWSFVSREQAMQACARAGKRLPTSGEWYQLTLGLSKSESRCNVSSGSLSESGSFASCTSPSGISDLVGNVWEWVSDDVIDGAHNGRTLPRSGYVHQVDSSGMATVSTTTAQNAYGSDYFWSKSSGAYGILRGGYYDSGTDAGIYAVHADTPPNTVGTAIGFRCVK